MCTSSIFSDFARLPWTLIFRRRSSLRVLAGMARADSAGSAGVRPATAHGSAMLVASSPGPNCRSGRKTQARHRAAHRLGEGAAVPPCRAVLDEQKRSLWQPIDEGE
jgi:hypothetical protein